MGKYFLILLISFFLSGCASHGMYKISYAREDIDDKKIKVTLITVHDYLPVTSKYLVMYVNGKPAFDTMHSTDGYTTIGFFPKELKKELQKNGGLLEIKSFPGGRVEYSTYIE